MDTSFLSFAVLSFLAIVLFLEGAYLFWNSRHGAVVRRMDERVRALSASGSVEVRQLSILKQRLLSDSPLMTRLLQAGVSWSIARFLTYMLVGAATGLAVGMMLHVPVLIACAMAVGCALLPLFIVRRRRGKRVAKLERQLPEAADLIARALRAGHSFPAALGMAGDELPDPLGGEFRLAFDEINYGVSMNDALLNMVSRVPVDDLRYFVIAVLIQREAGGNLAEILGSISGIIRERLKLLGKVRVLSAEGRLSAWILGVLPFAIVGLLSILNPVFISVFWTDPVGEKLAGVALAMMALGVLWMRKVVRIRV
jgi:tight adherence protein B